MSRSSRIPIPKGHTASNVADIFSAWLLGSMAFSNESRRYGPFEQERGKWQLDGSNDYWLRPDDDGDALVLSCRYEGQSEIVAALTALFMARYVNR